MPAATGGLAYPRLRGRSLSRLRSGLRVYVQVQVRAVSYVLQFLRPGLREVLAGAEVGGDAGVLARPGAGDDRGQADGPRSPSPFRALRQSRRRAVAVP